MGCESEVKIIQNVMVYPIALFNGGGIQAIKNTGIGTGCEIKEDSLKGK